MYRVYSLLTTTGEVGSEFDPASCSWSIELNKTPSIDVTVLKQELYRRERKWWAPWSGGVLVTYTGADGVEHPVEAGPITDYGTESSDKLPLVAAGIRKVFEHRVIAQNLSFAGVSLGDIAWGLVEHAMDVKPGGGLPVEHGQPVEAADRVRNYHRWNLSNNTVDKLLTELSEVINGPDIMFRPVWSDDTHRRIKWVLVHGTHRFPGIPQKYTPDFDMTAPATGMTEPVVNSTGQSLRCRVWATGSGEGDGIKRFYEENLKPVENGMPFLEEVISYSDQDDEAFLRDKALGELVAASHMLDQVTFGFPANSTKTPLGSFFVGDTATVTLKDFITVPDGSREMKIIKMNGSIGSPTVTLDFQKAVYE